MFEIPPSAGLASRTNWRACESISTARAHDEGGPAGAHVWQDLAQSLFNLKEFLYLR